MQANGLSAPSIPKTYEEYKAEMEQRKEKGDGMDKDAFMNLLIEQMKNQDPLSPMESADFTQQTATFSQLEQMISMNETLTKLFESQVSAVTTDNELMQASNFIGRLIEYNTNTLTIGENGTASNISFYASGAAGTGQVQIFDGDGALVGTLNLQDIKNGANAFTWDGKTSAGVKLPAGAYSFRVTATDTTGKAVTVGTYSEAEVIGVKSSGGKVYYEVEGGLVPADTVYSVRNKEPAATPTPPKDDDTTDEVKDEEKEKV